MEQKNKVSDIRLACTALRIIEDMFVYPHVKHAVGAMGMGVYDFTNVLSAAKAFNDKMAKGLPDPTKTKAEQLAERKEVEHQQYLARELFEGCMAVSIAIPESMAEAFTERFNALCNEFIKG